MVDNESIILQSMWLLNPKNDSPPSFIIQPTNIPYCFSPPLLGFLESSFNGASKGNLGLVGYGSIFRDIYGEAKYLIMGNCGIDCNNVKKFKAMELRIK